MSDVQPSTPSERHPCCVHHCDPPHPEGHARDCPFCIAVELQQSTASEQAVDLVAFTIGYVQPTVGLIGSGLNKMVVYGLADRIVKALIHAGWSPPSSGLDRARPGGAVEAERRQDQPEPCDTAALTTIEAQAARIAELEADVELQRDAAIGKGLQPLLGWLAADQDGRVAEIQVAAQHSWGPNDEDEGITAEFVIDLHANEYGVGDEHAHGSYKAMAEGDSIEQAFSRAVVAMDAFTSAALAAAEHQQKECAVCGDENCRPGLHAEHQQEQP